MAEISETLSRLKARVNDKLWVNPEYAREFAVLSAWLSLLLPWSLTYGRLGSGDGAGTVFQMRFPYIMIQYVSGVPFVEAFQLRWAHELMALEQGNNEGLVVAFAVWLVGSALLTVAFVLSLLLYGEADFLDEYGEMTPVRAMGVLLLLTGIVMTVSDVFLWQSSPGRQIPVFTLFYYVFAVVLLAIEEPQANPDPPT